MPYGSHKDMDVAFGEVHITSHGKRVSRYVYISNFSLNSYIPRLEDWGFNLFVLALVLHPVSPTEFPNGYIFLLQLFLIRHDHICPPTLVRVRHGGSHLFT